MSIIEQIIGIIAPHECLSCKAEGSLLCTICQSKMALIPSRCYRCRSLQADSRTCVSCRRQSDLWAVWPATVYDGVAKQLIHALKFERAAAAAGDAAMVVTNRLPRRQAWVVTYIPTAPPRVRQRGYDQAERIAQAVARQLGCPFVPLLARQSNQRQVGARRNLRRKQMKDVFRPIHAHNIVNQHVLVIDDVITTGSTLEEAARTLRRAGARRVSAAVFAAA